MLMNEIMVACQPGKETPDKQQNNVKIEVILISEFRNKDHFNLKHEEIDKS